MNRLNNIRWFHYKDVYEKIFHKLTEGSVFVEIGALLGESTVFMAGLCQEHNKNIKIYTVDKWCIDAASEEYMKHNIPVPDFFEMFKQNITEAGVSDLITPLRGDSASLAVKFQDGTIDAIFYDGDHSYNGLKRDVLAYQRKLTAGAIQAGDDYAHPAFPGISLWVNEFYGEQNITLFPSTDQNTNHKIWVLNGSL